MLQKDYQNDKINLKYSKKYLIDESILAFGILNATKRKYGNKNSNVLGTIIDTRFFCHFKCYKKSIKKTK
jgi:hypothetical protein